MDPWLTHQALCTLKGVLHPYPGVAETLVTSVLH